MTFAPWSYVSSWRCTGCGLCCREFEVVLTFDEWFNIMKRYGAGATKAGLNKFYIAKRPDNSCIFLYMAPNGRWLCGLQHNKPLACKLWPFKVLSKPSYGHTSKALFEYEGQRFYVYVDPFCPGIRWGPPSVELVHKVIPEFIELALGIRKTQIYSTMTIKPTLYLFRVRDNHKII